MFLVGMKPDNTSKEERCSSLPSYFQTQLKHKSTEGMKRLNFNIMAMNFLKLLFPISKKVIAQVLVFCFILDKALLCMQAGPELTAILLSQPPECLDYRPTLPCPVYFVDF